MFKNFSIILFLILSINLHSQWITGKVSDFVTDNPVSFAQVEVFDVANNTADTVLSNLSGYWQSNILTSVENENITPSDFALNQNYPNPFNPSTIISFDINSESEITLSIHNILGELIDSRKQFLAAGSYSIEWQSNAGAGVYFYTLQSGNQSVTKKMVQMDAGRGSGLGEFFGGGNTGGINFGKAVQTEIRVIATKFGYLPDTLFTSVSSSIYLESTMETVHNSAVLIDLHNDVLEKMVDDPNYRLRDFHTYNHTDIPRMITGGVDVQFFAVWVNPYDYPTNAFPRAQDMIQIFNTEMTDNPNAIAQARTLAEAEQINAEGKIAAVLAVEGGHAIDGDINKFYSLYDAGMRYLTITWNNSTPWAVSAQDPRSTTVGLNDFGRQIIRAMDSLGVIIDVSHTGIKTIQDILEVTNNPIIATHSGVRAIQNHYRNLYDTQITDIANSGGVIGIVFYPPFLGSPSSSVDISTVIDHIDYIVNLVGIDYVAVGSDFDGIGTNTVNGLEDISKFPALTMALLNHGYTQEDIEKILGGNFKRVFEQVCGSAKLEVAQN